MGDGMAAVTIRNLSEATHRALKVRAAQNGRSAEAEMRAILETAISETPRIKLGSELAALGRELGGVDLDVVRDKTPADPPDFA